MVPDTFSRRSDNPHTNQTNPVSNVLPNYANTMGPPDWVSSPIIASFGPATASPATPEDTTASELLESFVMGLALAKLEQFNNQHDATCASLATTPMEAITWQMLEAACRQCPEYKLLHQLVQQGVPDDGKDWDKQLLPYYRHRHHLVTAGPVVLLNDRPVVPRALRPRVVDHLHAGHPGLSTLCERMASSLYWPDYKEDLTKSKLSCPTCRVTAPSNPALPPSTPVAPRYPFQSIVCDFFTLSGKTYAAIADRYSNWLSVLHLKRDSSPELITSLRSYFSTFGIPELFSTDGASIFTSAEFTEFCARWGIN